MSRIFITSDWHFNHDQDFVYLPRGFSSVAEMNEEIVKRHNEIVAPEDEVYCLGDCCLGDVDLNESNKNLIESLNGKIHIVTGNHCSNNKIKIYENCNNVVEIKEWVCSLKYKKYKFYLSHFPTLCSNFDEIKPLKARIINLCGHTHTLNPFLDFDKNLIYHVELDAHNCYPVLLDNIIDNIKGKIREKGEKIND